MNLDLQVFRIARRIPVALSKFSATLGPYCNEFWASSERNKIPDWAFWMEAGRTLFNAFDRLRSVHYLLFPPQERFIKRRKSS